tara:strand:+ start:273 stop:521 length:249 start_codon:yes stop_codon:yes gene_type:complete
MENIDFCNKIGRKIGGKLKLVEKERDYFRVETDSVWLRGTQSIYLSDEFKEWLKVFVLRNFKKNVKWDNLGLDFWIEDKNET